MVQESIVYIKHKDYSYLSESTPRIVPALRPQYTGKKKKKKKEEKRVKKMELLGCYKRLRFPLNRVAKACLRYLAHSISSLQINTYFKKKEKEFDSKITS